MVTVMVTVRVTVRVMVMVMVRVMVMVMVTVTLMAFSDIDIHSHMRSIGLTKRSSITNYAAIGIPDEKHQGEGKEPHFAGLRRKNTEVYTLAHTHKRDEGSLMKPLHWCRSYESDEVKE